MVAHLARPAAERPDRARGQAGGAGEDEDARPPLVEYVGVAGGVERHRDRAAQDRRTRGGGAPDGGDRAVRVQQLDAPVDRVGDRAQAVGVGADAHRRVELAGSAARCAEGAQQLAAAVEDVDAVVAGVRDVQRAAAVRGDRARVGELARAGAVAAPARAVLVVRLRAEAQDALVDVVGDEDAALRIDRDAEREAELVLAGALAAADRPDHAPAEVHDDEPVVMVVGDDQPLAAHRQAARVGEQAGRDDLGGARAVEVEALDAVVLAVGDEQEVPGDRQTAAGRRVVAAARAEVELADVRAALAEGVDERAVGAEAIDPAVAAAGDEQRVVAGHRHRADRRELAGAQAREPDLADEPALRGEDLDDARGLVADVDGAVGPDRDRLREAQDAAAALADLRAGGVRTGAGRARARGLGRRAGGDGEGAERERAAHEPGEPAMGAAGHRRCNHGARR